jgi:kynurenine formamidase
MGDTATHPWDGEHGPVSAGKSALPRYGELPVGEGAPAGSSWGVWGADDRLGCLHLLTAERVLAASALVERGVVFALDADLATPGPPLFGRQLFRHEVTGADDGPSHDDVLHGWNTQGSTQWDGFRHIRHPVHGWYGGAPEGAHGIHTWAERGIVGRAVLADVARWRHEQGRPLDMDAPDPITADDLVATLDAQGTVPEVGDVLLVRTGWLGWYLGLDADRRSELASGHRNPGLHPEERTAEVLWDLHVAAVAADNPSLEIWPPGALHEAPELAGIRADPARRPEIFLHQRLLPLLGIPIGELFVLDTLADDCAAEGNWEGLFTSAPLNLRHGVASPPNALVIR